jgi:NAD(P)H-dependent flavin oxidoreductase YrpB (nitropropane dioxygenase family)
LAQPAFAKIDRAVEKGNVEAKDLASYWVGQGVGLIDSVRSTGHVVQDFKEEFGEAVMNLNSLLE